MSKLGTRILLFLIGFPMLISLIYFLPQYRHLALNIVIVAASAFGAAETGDIVSKAGIRVPRFLPPLLGAVLPLLMLFSINGLLPMSLIPPIALFIGSLLFFGPAFTSRTEDFPSILPRITSLLLLLIYPGLFLSYAVLFSTLPHASWLITAFVLAVYLNDAAAYAAGNLWGGGSRNLLPISPNKSLVGFIAGFFASIIVLWSARAIFPFLFPGSAPSVLFLGAGIGVLTILGDLVESALKRSVQVKDSGNIIPGRGGLLDSVDSILFCAPFFYYSYTILFLH